MDRAAAPSWARRLWQTQLMGLALAPVVAAEARGLMKRSRRRDLVEACQERRLVELVHHAVAHVPFYREHYRRSGAGPADFKSQADLARLPLLTKAHLRRFLPAMVAENCSLAFSERRRTSGSTGIPLDVVVSLRALVHSFARIQARLPQLGLRAADFAPFRPNYLYLSHTEPNPQFRCWSERLPVFRLARFEKRDIRRETDDERRALLQQIQRMRPAYVHGKPSSIAAFVEMAEELDPGGRFRFRPQVVVTGAEQLTTSVRAKLADALGCPVFDSYGLQEVGPVACECTAREGLHVEDDTILVEVLREGRRAAPFEPGELVVTSLCEWTVPIIRYRTGDIARITYEPCACGLAYPRIVGLGGRVVDLFVSPAGRTVHPFSMIGRLREIGLDQFQLAQLSRHDVVVRFVGRLSEAEVCAAVESAVRTAMGDGVIVRAERVARIGEPGKKARPYVREFDPGKA